jgi:outer membrane receptor protein involved in Fe transport
MGWASGRYQHDSNGRTENNPLVRPACFIKRIANEATDGTTVRLPPILLQPMAALGVLYRSDMFATIDNSVVLPGYTRADVAGYFRISKDLRLQVNVENVTNVAYYINADSNTNISPGFPRTARVALVTTF